MPTIPSDVVWRGVPFGGALSKAQPARASTGAGAGARARVGAGGWGSAVARARVRARAKARASTGGLPPAAATHLQSRLRTSLRLATSTAGLGVVLALALVLAPTLALALAFAPAPAALPFPLRPYPGFVGCVLSPVTSLSICGLEDFLLLAIISRCRAIIASCSPSSAPVQSVIPAFLLTGSFCWRYKWRKEILWQ
jgi:hypothetical protein